MSELTFKIAERKDSGLILEYIKKLADYEKRLDEVIATEDAIEKWVFDEKQAEVIFALVDGTPVGFALYFLSFSTYIGNVNMHLEDLFVDPEHRGKGYGKGLIKKLAQIAVERGCGRLEWWCLDWNKPSIDFYLSLGAEPMDDWTVYRISGDVLQNLGKD